MIRLPNEIVANIISHLAAECRNHNGDDNDSDSSPAALAPYATVSRGWQQRIEAATFAHIRLTPARLASPLAAQALTPARVRRFVRSVHVDVLLPPYGEEARARREDEAERAVNDGVFTEVVRRVFELLAAARADSDVQGALPGSDQGGGDDGGRQTNDGGQEQHQRAGADAGYRPSILLSMMARSLSDEEDLDARLHRRNFGAVPPNDLFEARYESSYLDLRPAAGRSVQDEADALPELHCIKEFQVKHIPGVLWLRSFAPRALCVMASKMPGLESVDWELSDNEKRDVTLRKRLRADFAHAIQALPSSLRHFYLLYHRRPPLDHSFQPPSLLEETGRENNDKLSFALHKLSQRLVTFHLMADVGSEILWPLEHTAPDHHHHQQDNDPFWPMMRRYRISPGMIAPSGEWRFRRPQDASDSDWDDDSVASYFPEDYIGVAPGDEKEDPFRQELDPDAARALLLAAARAARRMPALREMRLMLDAPPGRGTGELEVEYKAMPSTPRDDSGRAELVVESHPANHPDEEVLQAWREAAREHTGAESGLVVMLQGYDRV